MVASAGEWAAAVAPAAGASNAAAAESTAVLKVEVAYAPRAGVVDVVTLHLPVGTTMGDAVRASGLAERHGLEAADLRCGVWGKVKPPNEVLRDRDRVEIYRPLQVDPKEARRQRYKRHLERFGGKASAPGPDRRRNPVSDKVPGEESEP